MIHDNRRRDFLLTAGAATLAGLTGGLAVSAPAHAGAGWGPGPRSGLPFWLGTHGDYPSLIGLLPSGRGVDLVCLWESAGTYVTSVGKDAPVPKAGYPKGWATNAAHAYLKNGQTSAVQWMSSPFCSGSAFVVPSAWPGSAADVNAGVHLNCSVPPTYTGAETVSERTAKQRRVWQIAADGWLEPVWRSKLLQFKQNYFVWNNLRDIRIVMRLCHELNTKTKWGDKTYRPSYGMMTLTTLGDYQIVQEGLRRYIAVFLDVFGNTQTSIPGDFSYSDNQLWPYWNTHPDHKGLVDVRLTCPSNAKLVGPDYYNFWPATLTDAEWNSNLYAQSKQGWPKGVGAWLNWAKSIGRPFCLGEFALMTSYVNPDGTRPVSDGWDNPVFIKKMLDFLKANAADIGFASYFNGDPVPSPDLPGHLIKTWPGIETPSTNCVRFPVGDNNRCGARAFRQWMIDN